MNLLDKTVGILKDNNLEPKDVLWVGNSEVKTDWENFAKIADIDYDSGFGGQKVATDLIVVGQNWWLERHKYDGSEWWEFKQLPKEPETKATLYRAVGGGSWSTLRKGTKVKKICDGVTTYLKLKDYIMFEDNWISENDKTLYNEEGVSFSVLDFQEVEENTLVMPDIMPYHNGWIFRKFSCVKLDKNVNVGDVFYTYI